MNRRTTLLALGILALGIPRLLTAQGGMHLLVVSGLSGEASFASTFETTAGTLIDVARERWKVPEESTIWLGERADGAPPTVSAIATRETIAAAFDSLAARSRPGDVVLVVLVGHGSGEGEGTRLSIAGPDPVATDYRQWVAGLFGRTVVFVNAASASGDLLPVLSGPDRVVITSTRSATERNATIFAQHFVHGIASDEGDANKDGTLTLLEAYDYARRAVDEAYTSTGRLLTEHAQLDDNGDREGTTDVTLPTALDGQRAARIILGTRSAPTDPRVTTLLSARRDLESAVEALRLRRDALSAADYADEMERLLVAIAEHTRDIRALETAGGGGAVTRLALCLLLSAAPLAGQSPSLRLDRVAAMERDWVRGERATAATWARAVTSAWERSDQGAEWSAADQIIAGRAWRMLGADDPVAVRQALAAFDAATARDTTALEGRLWAADLLLERYNAPDARAEYRAVLQRDSVNARAWLGLARAAAFEGRDDAASLAERSVAADASYAPAQLFLAQVRLEAEQYDSARVSAERGIALDDALEEGWGTVAAVAWLSDDQDGFAAAEQRARALNPRPAGFYVTLADAAARHRRYADAVRFADQARSLDSLHARAWGILGINQLRLGQMEQGRASLERAFARDPFHVWHKNTLDLLDQLASFRTVATARFRIVAPARDAEFLGTILGPLLEEAYDTLAARYAYQPPTPVRLELYSRHADFSVRTIGLTGMGALGVSFGTVLAMDAPAARPAGSWNIGSTAWHELAHTFTLGLSAHRVPRWVSEGLSVVEERRARAGWGAHASVAFVEALHEGELLPIERLNEGFTRPSGPGQLSLAYYQASLVTEMLERDFGIGAIRVLLQSYAEGMDDDAALLHATGLTTESLNVRFDGWLRERFAAPLAALAGDDEALFGNALREAGAALEGGNLALAVELFRAVRDRFPEHGDANGPNGGLALALLAVGDTVEALAALTRVTHQDETAGAANVLEAAVHAARSDTTAALAALQRATWIMPEDGDLRRHRAELSAAIGDHRGAVLERRALAALARTDPLSARTDLAEALLAADQPAEARRELLTVLEAAPRYERAQALLLEARARINGGGKP